MPGPNRTRLPIIFAHSKLKVPVWYLHTYLATPGPSTDLDRSRHRPVLCVANFLRCSRHEHTTTSVFFSLWLPSLPRSPCPLAKCRAMRPPAFCGSVGFTTSSSRGQTDTAGSSVCRSSSRLVPENKRRWDRRAGGAGRPGYLCLCVCERASERARPVDRYEAGSQLGPLTVSQSVSQSGRAFLSCDW